MSAMTVKSLSDQLSGYIPPYAQFLQMMNLVLPRLYAMGYWKDLVFETEIETATGYISIPEEAESVMAATVNNEPRALRSMWHDRRIVGKASTVSAYFGLVDDGYKPIKEDLLEDTTYGISIFPVSPATALPEDGTVYITYKRSNGATVNFVSTDLTGASISVAHSDIVSVSSIRLEGVPVVIEVKASSGTDTKVLATGRGDLIARYRRFRLHNPESNPTQTVFLLMKRSFQPIMGESDIVYLGNVNALKHGILATTAEDNADIERAQYHWTVCKQMLEEELDANRGGARPELLLDLYAGGGKPHNIY